MAPMRNVGAPELLVFAVLLVVLLAVVAGVVLFAKAIWKR